MDVLSVMDRAYERRHELLAQDCVKWVAMKLDPRGVTLTITKDDGSCQVEFMARENEN